MWLKSAIHELEKWVPTSSEYRREQLRAAAELRTLPDTPVRSGHKVVGVLKQVDTGTGEILDGDVIDGETIENPEDAALDAAYQADVAREATP